MPQLNPNPWLFIMMMTWLTFLLIIQPKLLSFTTTNIPPKLTTSTKTAPWTWPWT
uniref:ATP synthase complex subunit 8 n=1 Tax=Geococcyx californianus TaxID=8947 RepID=B7SLT3_GEOCA|nr:ATP synthase F0 subunit 8 [Geococcyx californianus]ABY82533.1 ATP synthase subunit 8 [Geococcyx californianus]ADM26355.1 ATP synthase F0 subunit 8 [Geococcyx californianus]QOD97516.1 ATP synthase F0 subunit 8 [Geococcyx californianus]